MSPSSKLGVVLLALALVASAGLSAQAAGNVDARIFCIDVGMATGLGIKAAAPLAGRTFGINLTVADNIAIGVASTRVDESATVNRTYKLLRLGYYLSPALGFNVYVGGQGTALATGAGAFYNIMKSKTDSSFANSLKVKLEYLFDGANGVAGGDIIVALATSIGY
jgi:hypothetical protein